MSRAKNVREADSEGNYKKSKEEEEEEAHSSH
jgi:hypothetical protein